MMEVDTPSNDAPRRQWVSDLWRIAFIMLLALTTRLWIVGHTEAISRDGIGFIQYSLQLEDPPARPDDPTRLQTQPEWLRDLCLVGSWPVRAILGDSRAEVLRRSYHPPGYSVSILVVSWPVRAIMGTTCDALTLSAQLASVLASLLLVIPMYFLGKLAFDRQTAFVGAMLFQVLPVSSHVGSDGLSDTLALCCIMTSAWLAAIGFQRKSWHWFLAAGLMSGLTYLVRPEGLLIVGVIGVVLLFWRLRREITWKTFFARGALTAAGMLIVMAPYMATIERSTNKPTALNFIKAYLDGDEIRPSWMNMSRAPKPTQRVIIPLAEVFDGYADGEQPDAAWAAKALAKEYLKTSFYVLPFFAALGLIAVWPRIWTNSAAVLIVALGFFHTLLLWQVAKGAGYVAERHTLLIVLCSCYFVAASFPIIGAKLARLPVSRRIECPATWSAIAAVMVIVACIPGALKTLHSSRAGHRAAGLWIAAHQAPSEYMIDPFAWGEFYAGHLRTPATIETIPHRVYIITEANANMHPRLHKMKTARFFADRGHIVYHWPENVPVEKAKVLVYQWDGSNFSELWEQAFREITKKM